MRPITGITFLGLRLGIIALIAYWIILFLGTHWPSGVKLARGVNDKSLHFAGYFALSWLLCYVTQSRQSDVRSATLRFGGIFLCLAFYAAIDEVTQGWIPGRYPDVHDFLADALGIAAAIAAYLTLRTLLKPKVSNRTLHTSSD